MSTYTFNNLNFTTELTQNADFIASIEESINDYLSQSVDFDVKFADNNTMLVEFDKDLTVAQLTELADCYAEILLMPAAFA